MKPTSRYNLPSLRPTNTHVNRILETIRPNFGNAKWTNNYSGYPQLENSFRMPSNIS